MRVSCILAVILFTLAACGTYKPKPEYIPQPNDPTLLLDIEGTGHVIEFRLTFAPGPKGDDGYKDKLVGHVGGWGYIKKIFGSPEKTPVTVQVPPNRNITMSAGYEFDIKDHNKYTGFTTRTKGSCIVPQVFDSKPDRKYLAKYIVDQSGKTCRIQVEDITDPANPLDVSQGFLKP